MEKRAYADLINDESVQYKLEKPEMLRSVFFGDSILVGRNVIRDISHCTFDDGSQSSCTGVLLNCPVCNCSDSILLEN